jgi:Putative prokaryotic signal transducing protein
MAMHTCPACGAFYVEGAACPRCGARSGNAPPEPAPRPDAELVPVFRTGDEARILVAKSLLEAEGIDYLARGDGLQDLFGWGRLAAGFNYIVGPVEFVVRKEDAERARQLLQEL